MVDEIRILYFLEDRAQEGFIKALVERIAKEESIPTGRLIHDVRLARGGSKIINEFKKFLKDTMQGTMPEVDLLIVVIDGDCKGHRERIRQLGKYFKENHPFREKVVYAIPDPHIERWYLMDQRALKQGVGLEKTPDLPSYKCKRAHYKQLLHQALKESNVNSLLGGLEYAERIVDNIENLKSLGETNAGFQDFVEDLRRRLRQCEHSDSLLG